MYKTKEYVHKDDNGDVVSTVNVYIVDDEHDGENVQTVGEPRQVHKGDVLIQSPNPRYWDVLTADEFNKSGYAPADGSKSATVSTKK